MDHYSGTSVLLGTRVAYLPTAEDLSDMKPEAAKYAAIDAVMPEKNDIITIKGIASEWLVEDAEQSTRMFDFCICHLREIQACLPVTLGEYLQVRVAYDQVAFDATFIDCTNRRQVMWGAVFIVGQVQHISLLVRIPDLPKGVGLL